VAGAVVGGTIFVVTGGLAGRAAEGSGEARQKLNPAAELSAVTDDVVSAEAAGCFTFSGVATEGGAEDVAAGGVAWGIAVVGGGRAVAGEWVGDAATA